MLKSVRVIRTYKTEVEAVYGDTEEDLVARGQAAVDGSTPYTETAVLLPDEDIDNDTPVEPEA